MSFFSRKKQPATATPAAPRNVPQPKELTIPPPLQSNRPANGLQPTPPPAQPAAPRQAAWPWAVKHLAMLPQSPLPRSQSAQPNVVSSAPFPRYGHSVPATSNQNGELFLFGGLVRDSVRNDLYCIAARENSAAVWQVQGEIPSPRVGHASALVSNVLIVWGGDTKTDGRAALGEKLDDGLYLLNLVTREWTRVEPEGPKPLGRYGHAVTMVGTRFYLFGGQVDGEFLNDLWSFDLNSLVRNEPRWELSKPVNEPPHRRTGHACVSYGELLYVFGGTDGQYHYNDTWCFDPRTGTWTELQCIGFIPAPREGHAAALVDDVMYVFGGRGVDGKDLGDLTGFKISNRRWYMFQNMGPAPSGRSGHSMAAIGSRVYVLGGESYTAAKPDEPNAFHVLDSKHIKYPEAASQKQLGQGRKPSLTGSQHLVSSSQHQSGTGPISSDVMRATSPALSDNLKRTTSPPNIISNAALTDGYPNTTGQRSHQDAKDDLSENKEGRASLEAQYRERELQQARTATPEITFRGKSPTPLATRSASPAQVAVNGNLPPHQPSLTRGVLPERTLSPVGNRAVSPEVPAQSTDIRIATSQSAIDITHQGAPSYSNVTAELVKSLRADLESAQKRETWLKSLLLHARKEGFSVPLDVPDSDTRYDALDGTDEPSSNAIFLSTKHARMKIQNEMIDKVREASERITEAEKMRDGALQETAYYRAKLIATEAGSLVDSSRLEADRIEVLESKLNSISAEHDVKERKIKDLQDLATLHAQLKEQAELRSTEACRRAESLENSREDLHREHFDLRERHNMAQIELRERTEKLALQTSLADQRMSDLLNLKAQFDSLTTQHQQHIRFLEQTHAALDASSSKALEADNRWHEASQRISELEAELLDARAELDTKSTEAAASTMRLTQVENAWAKSREEADSLRSLTTRGLGELLDSHRDMRADEDRITQGHSEKIKAFEVEILSLRNAHTQISQQADIANKALTEYRDRIESTETDYGRLQSQIASLRSQLAEALGSTRNLRLQLSQSEIRREEHAATIASSDLRYTLLCRHLSERGVDVTGEDLPHPNNTSDDTAELKVRLAQSVQTAEAAQAELNSLRGKHQIALDELGTLSRDLAILRSRADSTELKDATNVESLQRALADTEKTHQERMKQLENDYHTAVHYVKGTEKMLRRMKEELARQKTANSTLQAELDSIRRGTSPTDPIVKSRSINGRGTPLSDESIDATIRAQLVEVQRQNQRLISDNQELRRRLDSTERDLELLRDTLNAAQREAVSKGNEIERLEIEMEQLDHSLSLARQGQNASFVEQLSAQNQVLQRKNEELSKKIELLLEVDQAEFNHPHPASDISDDRVSRSSSDNARAFESFSHELDDWQRKLVGSGHRPGTE